jgi:hypothetical protein
VISYHKQIAWLNKWKEGRQVSLWRCSLQGGQPARLVLAPTMAEALQIMEEIDPGEIVVECVQDEMLLPDQLIGDAKASTEKQAPPQLNDDLETQAYLMCGRCSQCKHYYPVCQDDGEKLESEKEG